MRFHVKSVLYCGLTVQILIWVVTIYLHFSENSVDYAVTSLPFPEGVGSDDRALIQFLKEKVLLPPSSMPYNLSKDKVSLKFSHSYSWPFIDSILHHLFSDSGKGFFVEAGALDGEFLSNTLWLEQKRGWTGLLVEPENRNFRDMVWKRRKSWLSHSCLSDELFSKEVVMVSTMKKPNSEISSLVARGSSYNSNYKISDKKSVTGVYNEFDHTYYTSQCYPLTSLLLTLNISTVDFLSLDLQGPELNVFRTIPLDKIFIRSFVIEDSDVHFNYSLTEHINGLGFDLLAVNVAGPDYFFVNKNDSALMKIAKTLGMAQKMVDEHLKFEFAELPFGNYSYDHILMMQEQLKILLAGYS